MNFKDELEIRSAWVEEVVRAYLPEEAGYQETLIRAMNYSVLNGGKRIRPLLIAESYRMYDGRGKVVEPFMAAMEYIHSYSLIHDDLPAMDNDALRRGQPSTWKAFGEGMGILAGDGLLTYAFEVACKAFPLSNSPLNVGKALEILANKAGIYGMAGGQSVDIEKSGLPLSELELRYIHENKTAGLIEGALMIGATLAEASSEDVKRLQEIGRKIGLAFQIRDDILDETASTVQLGKPGRSDKRNEKTTYLTLVGVDAAMQEVTRLTEEAISEMQYLAGENRMLELLLKEMTEREK